MPMRLAIEWEKINKWARRASESYIRLPHLNRSTYKQGANAYTHTYKHIYAQYTVCAAVAAEKDTT